MQFTVKFILALAYLLLLFSIIDSKQLYVSEVYRHGARYSLHDFYDYNQTKQFAGLLTSVGLRQHFLLGSYIQHDYIQAKEPLLNATLHPKQTQFFTMITDTGRCEQSAYAQILGMFPFGNGEKIPSYINPQLLEPPFETIFPSSLTSQQTPQAFALQKGFQPVPIRYGMQFFPDCPNLNLLLSKRTQEISRDLATFQTEQSVFTTKMKLVFNLSVTQSNVASLQELADTLICDKWLNRDLPTDFTDADFKQIYYIRAFMLSSLYAGQVAKAINGPYLLALLENMQLKISNKLGPKKYTSIAIHDLNMIPLLTFYNLTSGECLRKQFKNQTVTQNCVDPIPFASNLIFELHQNDSAPSSYIVKVRYNGVYYKIFGKNTTEIDFTQFQTRTKKELLDFNTECKVKSSQQPTLIVQQ